MEIVTNSQEESLLNTFCRLPPDAPIELSRLIVRLVAAAPHRKIDWLDSWSDKDLPEFRATPLLRLEVNESEDIDWKQVTWWLASLKEQSKRSPPRSCDCQRKLSRTASRCPGWDSNDSAAQTCRIHRLRASRLAHGRTSRGIPLSRIRPHNSSFRTDYHWPPVRSRLEQREDLHWLRVRKMTEDKQTP